MEKILLAMDANKPDRNAVEFACYLARLTKSKVTGVFLENQVLATSAADGSPAESALPDLVEKNIKWFNEKCINEETRYSFHTDRGVPVKELVEESRYADLVVIDSETSFNKIYEGSPTKFVKEFLNSTECPVVIAPESFDGIDEIVVAYDGTPSSVFAIKQFTYLFPQLNTKKISIVHVNNDNHWKEEEKDKFSDWLKGHYTHMHFVSLRGEPDTALFDFLLRRENIFLVMGAYGRSNISQFLKHSRAELIIKTITQPIFIAHH
jgi:hypothetical protein